MRTIGHLVARRTLSSGADYPVEPDASSAASYFWAAAAIRGGRVVVDGLGPTPFRATRVRRRSRAGWVRTGRVRAADSIEATARAAEGHRDRHDRHGPTRCRRSPRWPPFAASPTRVTGVGFIRRKETDRIAVAGDGTAAVGVDAAEEARRPRRASRRTRPRGAIVHTYDDHRMAMSCALVGLRIPGVRIADPALRRQDLPDVTGRALDAMRATAGRAAWSVDSPRGGNPRACDLAIDGPAGSGSSTVGPRSRRAGSA